MSDIYNADKMVSYEVEKIDYNTIVKAKSKRFGQIFIYRKHFGLLEFQLKTKTLKDTLLKLVDFNDLEFTSYRKTRSFVGRGEDIYTLECQRKCNIGNKSPKVYKLTASLVEHPVEAKTSTISEKISQVNSCPKPLPPKQREAHRNGGKSTVTLEVAAACCGVSTKTITRWDKVPPQGYPGRVDALSLQMFASRYKDQKKINKEARKNNMRRYGGR